MDIKLVPYADKVTGSNTTAGKVSADDLNQIKKILNAIVQALFTLDGSGVATSAVVKLAALPDVELLDYFNDATVVGGKLTIGTGSGSGGGSLPAGTAPTAFVVDDTANTAGFTPAAGTVATDYEYSINGGTSYANVTANPIAIGNVALAVGSVKIRAKATSSHSASAAISNATAYTVAGGGSGLTVLAALDQYDSLSPVSGSPGSFKQDNTVANNNATGYGVKSTLKLPSGVAGEIRWQPTTTPGPGTSEGWVGLYRDAQLYRGQSDSEMAARRNNNGSIGWRFTTASESGTPDNTLAMGGYLRIRSDGTIIYLERSTDQTTWTIVTQRNLSAPKDMYIHVQVYATDQDKVSNIKYSSGFVAV